MTPEKIVLTLPDGTKREFEEAKISGIGSHDDAKGTNTYIMYAGVKTFVKENYSEIQKFREEK